MRRSMKLFGPLALLAAVVVSLGCGGGGSEAPVINPEGITAAVQATVNANGTVTTGAVQTLVPLNATGVLAQVAITVPANTVITAKNLDGSVKPLTAPPSFTFSVPADSTATTAGIYGLTPPPGSQIASVAGALWVDITGAPLASFSNPVTVTIPVPGKTVGTVLPVIQIKENSTTEITLGNFTVQRVGLLDITVSDFCEFQAGRVLVTGSTGGTGGTL